MQTRVYDKQECRCCLLSGRNVRWPRHMLPLVSHGQYVDGTWQTDGRTPDRYIKLSSFSPVRESFYKQRRKPANLCRKLVYLGRSSYNWLTRRAVEDLADPAVVGSTSHVPSFSWARTANDQLIVAFTFYFCSVIQLQISAANHYNTTRRIGVIGQSSRSHVPCIVLRAIFTMQLTQSLGK